MKLLSFIGAIAIIVAVGAAVFFFGGFYNVAATQPDLGIVAWALEHVRTASIGRHATEQPPVSLDDPQIIHAGAKAFVARGCTNCHGGPGVDWAKFSEGLHPDPPDLKDRAPVVSAAYVFWVVKNGINMTGMPAFEKIAADDREIWSIAAFVKQIPNVSDADFKTWTAVPADAPPAEAKP